MTTRYNLKNIRTLFTEGFTDEDLRRLCYDIPDFRPVYDRLSQNSSKAEIIDRLLEHADRTLQIENLLFLAKEHNPARYEKHQPYYGAIPNLTTSNEAHREVQKAEAKKGIMWLPQVWWVPIVVALIGLGAVIIPPLMKQEVPTQSPTSTSLIPTTTLTALPPSFITISEPQGTLKCINSTSEDDCHFEIKGTVEGVASFKDFRIYTFVQPVNPEGFGWYIQQPVANIRTGGDWTQIPAILGAKGTPAKDGHTLQIQAALVRADATYDGTKLNASKRGFYVSAVQDIEGIVAWSDTVFLTVQR